MTSSEHRNVDLDVVKGFGEEWTRFSNETLSEVELQDIFEQYTAIFPWDQLPVDAVGFDAGCGSGRWAKRFAPRVGRLHCIDASAAAIDVARRQLAGVANVEFHVAPLNEVDLPAGAFDFGYSLGVLHHIPDTLDAARACVGLLKPRAPFLVYLYYSLEGAPALTRALFRVVSVGRAAISRMPTSVRHRVCDAIAVCVYWPLARLSRLVDRLGRDPRRIPLSAYRDRTFYVMRNDALDRFGTRLEQRFSRAEVIALLIAAGLESIVVSDAAPFWVAVGYRPESVPATAT